MTDILAELRPEPTSEGVAREDQDRLRMTSALSAALDHWTGALPDQIPQAESLHESMLLALADAALGESQAGAPLSVEWGVVLDDLGSTDTYPTRPEAEQAANGLPTVRIEVWPADG